MSDNQKHLYRKWHWVVFSSLCFCLLYLTSCTPEFPKEIKEFYYPIDQLEEGLVYHYESSINDAPKTDEYWVFKTHNLDNKVALTGQFYNTNKTVEQYFRQLITTSGALLEEYRLYRNDSIVHTIPVEVIYNNVFPFAIQDTNAVFLYKLKYTNPADSSINTIIRNRRYAGTTIWEHNGKTYEAIQINILEQFQNDNNGVLTIDFKGYEIYAKEIGLVFTERFSEDGGTHLIDQLIDRIPM